MRTGDAYIVRTGVVEWAAAGRPYPGESESGDWYAVRPVHGGLLAAVIDGLGHGREAAAAARAASDVFGHGALESLPRLITDAHRALKGTRGAVVAAAVFAPESNHLEWSGIGNVEGFLVRADPAANPQRRYLLSRGGILGSEPFPELRTEHLQVGPGDTLVLATDGILSSFPEAVDPARPPAVNAGRILEGYARDTDDALILVARFREIAE